jgi:hypothetical protein
MDTYIFVFPKFPSEEREKKSASPINALNDCFL